MNLFSLRALWKGLKGKSLTFSLIFAMTVMGFSFGGVLRNTFRSIGLWAPLIWIFPLLITGFLAKNEGKLKVSDSFRRMASYGLIFASLLISFSLWKYQDYLEEKYPKPEYLIQLDEAKKPTRKLGPRGK